MLDDLKDAIDSLTGHDRILLFMLQRSRKSGYLRKYFNRDKDDVNVATLDSSTRSYLASSTLRS